MNILGDTLQLIAREKAGIIKPGIPVIIGEYQPEVAQTFIEKAKQEHSRISFASELQAQVMNGKPTVSGSGAEIEVSDFLDVKITTIPLQFLVRNIIITNSN